MARRAAHQGPERCAHIARTSRVRRACAAPRQRARRVAQRALSVAHVTLRRACAGGRPRRSPGSAGGNLPCPPARTAARIHSTVRTRLSGRRHSRSSPGAGPGAATHKPGLWSAGAASQMVPSQPEVPYRTTHLGPSSSSCVRASARAAAAPAVSAQARQQQRKAATARVSICQAVLASEEAGCGLSINLVVHAPSRPQAVPPAASRRRRSSSSAALPPPRPKTQ